MAGLTAALCLLARGWEVRLFERAPEIAEVGAGIQLSPNATKPLIELGLGEALARAACEPARLEMRLGRSGRRVFSIDWAPALRRRYGAPYLMIHRADLIEILRVAVDARAPGAIRLGAEVAGCEDGALRLASGETVEGDLLLGADGLRSTVRARICGPESPVFTGNVAWRCVAPAAACPGLPRHVCVWAGPGRHAVTYPLRGGALMNFVGIVEREEPAAETWSGPASHEETLALFSGWDARLTRTVEAAPKILKWGLYGRPPLPRWTAGRAALIGDACHPMLPSLAQGAGQAIEDAWVLAALADRPQGLARYEALRKPRASRVQRQSLANLRMFHRSNPLAAFATYAPMAAAGQIAPDAIRRRNHWIYRVDATRAHP